MSLRPWRHSQAGLQEHLRLLLIELARQPDVATVVERIRARKAHTGLGLSSDQILAYLDSDRVMLSSTRRSWSQH
jgi:hypothetical protein